MLTAAAAFLLCYGQQVYRNASAPIELVAGPWKLRETHRELTGQQRADPGALRRSRPPARGDVPALQQGLALRRHIAGPPRPRGGNRLDGRPVAIAMASDRLAVLQRPTGDDKHLGPGWWETFSLDGKSTSPRIPAGYYPDDLAVTPDGRFLIVLNSGQAEGDKKKPLPGIDVFQVASETEADSQRPTGHLSLDPEDDADRLFVSASGSRALVTLPKTKEAVAIDLTDPENPRLRAATDLAQANAPYVSVSPDGDWMIMPTLEPRRPWQWATGFIGRFNGSAGCRLPRLHPPRRFRPRARPGQSRPDLGQFPLKGPMNLGGTRPTGISFSPEKGLIAVATKPGTVYLISLRSRLGSDSEPPRARIATGGETTRR